MHLNYTSPPITYFRNRDQCLFSPTQSTTTATKNEARKMHITEHFILIKLDRNWDESRVFFRLHGDSLSSQPMICQSKDKWIMMWLPLRIWTKYCKILIRMNEWMYKTEILNLAGFIRNTYWSLCVFYLWTFSLKFSAFWVILVSVKYWRCSSSWCKQTHGWRRWASCRRCSQRRTQSWSHRGQPTCHWHCSSGGHRSHPGFRDNTSQSHKITQ